MNEEFCLVDNHDIKNTSKFQVKGLNKTLDNCIEQTKYITLSEELQRHTEDYCNKSNHNCSSCPFETDDNDCILYLSILYMKLEEEKQKRV